MKKLYTLISFFAFSASAIVAQVLPNPGFESWTHVAASFPAPAYDTPDNWNTLNPTTAGLGQITCTKATAAGEFNSGAAAIKLVTKSILGQTANGIATTGTINAVTQTIGGGVAYTGHPDSIAGYYRYTPVTGDNGFVEIQLLGSGGDTDTIGYVRFKTPTTTVGTFTRFSKAIVYRSVNPVANAIWIMSSSADATTHFVNSTLWVDDMQLITNAPANVQEQTKLEISVGPNPVTNNYFYIKNPQLTRAVVTVYDVTGRIVAEQQIENASNTIDINAFPMGLYIYTITDESKRVIKTGKLVFQK